MCEPISASALTAVAIGSSVVAAGVGAYGAIKTSEAQSAAANYQAQIAHNNQITADAAAADAKARGAVAQQQKANQTEQMIGRQRAASAANGVETNSGSSLDLQGDTSAAGELDQLTILNNADREATGYHNQGLNYGNAAKADEASSANALSAGALSASSSVISGAGNVAGQWYQINYGTRQQVPRV